MNSWSVGKAENGACRVLDAMGRHVGNLKWIRAVWKFKAIGYDASGAVIPGGGPLTDQHNTVYTSIDAWQVNLAPAAPTHGRRPAAVRGPAVPGG